MSDDEETIDFEGEVVGETALAWRFTDGRITVWLPKSQCSWNADEGVMTVPEWLTDREGLS